MTVSFEDILSVLCSQVTPSRGNDLQKVFRLEDAKEARLAFDLLIAYGFDAKLYNEQDAPKLYITLPADPVAIEGKLIAALGYAKTLKSIKRDLDALDPASASDYTMSFANGDGSKQIVIQVLPTGGMKSASADVAAAKAPAAPASVAPQAALPKRKKISGKTEEDSFSAGPAVARRGLVANAKPSTEPDGVFKQFWLYASGHAATGGTIVLGVAFVLIALFSIAVVSKGFLCPDLATVKRHVWYCPQVYDDNGPAQL